MKKLLIVVDYQKDFVLGALGASYAAAIENAVVQKIQQYRTDGNEIAFTFDTHDSNYMQTQEGRMLPVPHCIRDSDGWQLFGQTAGLLRPTDKRFCKSCFGSAELFAYLQQNSYQSIELIGVVTNICVLSNAVLAKTAQPETPVFVDAEATASNDPALHAKALDILESLQVTVTNREKENANE